MLQLLKSFCATCEERYQLTTTASISRYDESASILPGADKGVLEQVLGKGTSCSTDIS